MHTSDDWRKFLSAHSLVCSMSRRGNCHDNAPVESYFGLLKRERIRRRIYPTKEAARADLFDYIEMFYNPKRRHGSNGDVSPVEFERGYAQRGSSVSTKPWAIQHPDGQYPFRPGTMPGLPGLE